MRDDILKSLGLTEDDLNKMTPQDRAATEDKIRKLVQEKIKQGMTGDTASTGEDKGVGQFIQEIA